MASIHKDPRGKSPFSYCAFTFPNGKRVFRSTKMTDKAAALRYCLTMKDAAWKKDPRTHRKSRARFSMRFAPFPASPRFELQPRRLREGMVGVQASDCEPSDGVAVCGRCECVRRSRGPASHPRQDRDDHRWRCESLPRLSGARRKGADDGKPCAQNLRILFNDARREGLITVNPAEGVKTFDVEKEARDVFTHEQLCAIIRAASSEWKDGDPTRLQRRFAVGRCCGPCMGKRQLSSATRFVFFPRKTMGGRRHPDWKKHLPGQLEIPMMPELEAHLLSLPSSDDPIAPLCPVSQPRAPAETAAFPRCFSE